MERKEREDGVGRGAERDGGEGRREEGKKEREKGEWKLKEGRGSKEGIEEKRKRQQLTLAFSLWWNINSRGRENLRILTR